MHWRDERVTAHVNQVASKIQHNHEQALLAEAAKHAGAIRERDRELNAVLAWLAGALLLCLVLLAALLGATH